MTSIHFKSENQTWETPQDFFDKLDDLFGFNLDACAGSDNAKVSNYYTVEQNALVQDWKGVVWCNPPYGREQVKFIQKAYDESVKHGSTVVCLIPARPDTKVWQDLIFAHADQVCFIKGRLKFGNSKDAAPFPSALVVFGGSRDLSAFGKCLSQQGVSEK
jgi:site-specific DNA-methyltransferase (adenine-specific)